MKKQLLEQDNNTRIFRIKNIIIPVITGIIVFFSSCQRNSIEKINQLTSELNTPTVSVYNTEIIYSEGAIMKNKLTSKEVNRYLKTEEPYIEFPQGIHVQFFDSAKNVTSFIKANYCIYDENTKIWTAENDVISVNETGDTLNTEYLVWNQNTGKIYSDRYVRITNQDGIIHGKGLEANEDFSNWKIKQTSGTISVDNEK